MNRDSANATRLRVNRIALIQQLDVQELLPKLVRARILSMDHDVQFINQGSSRIDRARRLVDCLLTPMSIGKEAERGDRPANWFLLFRSILLENASIYGDLVAALDNTIIRTPEFAQRVADAFADKTNVERAHEFRTTVNKDLLRVSQPRQDPDPKTPASAKKNQEQITKIEFDRYAMNKILVEGQFQKVIDNLTYHSQVGDESFSGRSYLLVRSRHQSDYSNNWPIPSRSTMANNWPQKNRLSMTCVAWNWCTILSKKNRLWPIKVCSIHRWLMLFWLTPLIIIISTSISWHCHPSMACISIGNFCNPFSKRWTNRRISWKQWRKGSNSTISCTITDATNCAGKSLSRSFNPWRNKWNSNNRNRLCGRISFERVVHWFKCTIKVWKWKKHGHVSKRPMKSSRISKRLKWVKRISFGIPSPIDLFTEIPSHEYAWFYLTASQTAAEDANFDASIQYCYR